MRNDDGRNDSLYRDEKDQLRSGLQYRQSLNGHDDNLEESEGYGWGIRLEYGIRTGRLRSVARSERVRLSRGGSGGGRSPADELLVPEEVDGSLNTVGLR